MDSIWEFSFPILTGTFDQNGSSYVLLQSVCLWEQCYSRATIVTKCGYSVIDDGRYTRTAEILRPIIMTLFLLKFLNLWLCGYSG